MKRYLLDTHIFLWWLADDKKLDQRHRKLLMDPANFITIRTVSIWEIVIKQALGKLIAPDNLKEVLHETEFEVLAITPDHVMYLKQLPAIHHDPFDRLLIAQAIYEGLTLITADTIIPKYELTCD